RQMRREKATGGDPELHLLMEELPDIRPKSRSECVSMARPCLFVSCKYHLYLDVNPRTGSIKLNFPDKEIWEIGETCALDVADRGGITLEEVGDIMNLTRERIRQVESSGLDKIKDATCPDDEG
ncbi:MAG: sigma factor-like helix-turn-helix DNA-binding protein, partial [Myxococcota bacterium]